VKLNVYNFKLDIPFTAKEKYFDKKDNLIGDAIIHGTWNGVFTINGEAKTQEN